MAGLVRAIYPSTCAATDGPNKPGHDGMSYGRAGSLPRSAHPVGLVRAIATSKCRDRWPGRALGRTHISEIIWMINTLTARAERSPAVMAGLSGPSVAAQMA